MAESPGSIPAELPIEKLGLGIVVQDKAPFDPTDAVHCTKSQSSRSSQNTPDADNGAAERRLEENVCDDVELTNSIQRELLQLAISQFEIEAANERLDTINDEEEGNDVKKLGNGNIDEASRKVEEHDVGDEVGKDGQIVKTEDLGEDKCENNGENAEEGNEIERCDEEEDRNAHGGDAIKLGRNNQNNNRKRFTYPMRPDAEDCTYYMKFGSCKFGLNCKFNHPPRRKNQVKEKAKHREESSERVGQTECKYYLTSGGCRYGKDCKYSHCLDKSSSSANPEFNFLGLPIRPGEKECPFYMRNGSCKYGLNCRFHHPDPQAASAGGSPSGYGSSGSFSSQLVLSSSLSSWTSPRASNDTSPFASVMLPPTQGGATSTLEWNGYQAAAYPASERRNLPTPPAFALKDISAEIGYQVQHQPDIVVGEYSERPGEPECSFFLKTGDCKFKYNCKFHHPKSRNFNTKADLFALSDKGLPLRPDHPICMHYHRYGICKFGPACKYDHPAILPPHALPSPGNSKIVDGAETSRQGNDTDPLV